MPAHPLSVVAEPHADRVTPEGGVSAALRDLLDHHARGRDSAGHHVTAASHAGPSARLRALPQPTAGQLATADGVDDHLAQLEAARQAQLDALPATPRNVVAAAHRETVEWILGQVRAARQRVREDVYGLCARCRTRIPPDRLAAQPWVITCTACDPTDRPVLGPVPTPELLRSDPLR